MEVLAEGMVVAVGKRGGEEEGGSLDIEVFCSEGLFYGQGGGGEHWEC